VDSFDVSFDSSADSLLEFKSKVELPETSLSGGRLDHALDSSLNSPLEWTIKVSEDTLSSRGSDEKLDTCEDPLLP
jgi:hypothetical protein